ncbi:MAG: hypothetical protein KDJ97_02810 [Anaerolineae bacterium]|nr:hypothetical protein [Anaerolineae bacterium]
MNNTEEISKIHNILEEIDRLIGEMTVLKSQVAALNQSRTQKIQSIREADFFGMWADRDDMQGRTSQEWLDELRKKQWTHQ